MKKGILLIALFVAGTLGVKAQESTFGLRAGLNISSINGDDTDELDSKLGLHLGAFYNIGITDNIGFQPEILFSAKGAKIAYSESEAYQEFNTNTMQMEEAGTEKFELDGKWNLNYIQIPLLFTYTTDGASGLQFLAGPSLGYLVAVKEKAEVTFTRTPNDGSTAFTVSEEDESSDDEGYNKLDVGFQVGVGYIMASGLGVSVRYDHGFSNIFDDADDDDDKYNNSNIMVSLSYSLFR